MGHNGNEMKLRLLIATACGVMAVFLLVACNGDRTPAEPPVVTQPSATSGPSTFVLSPPLTPALTPMAVETTREASDYADDELPGIAQSLVDEFYGSSLSGSDFERAAATFSSFCRPESAEELAAMQDSVLAAEVVAVERLADHGMLVFTFVTADGALPRTEAHLVVFEGGRWVNNDCEAGRAAVAFGPRLIPSPEDAAREGSSPSLSKPRFPELSDTPAQHSNELIARSAEASLTAQVGVELAVPHPDLSAMRANGAAECQSLVDEDLARISSETRKTLRSVSYSFRYEVNAVERIDANRAWVSALKIVDGDLRDSTPPTLFTYWKGQWRMADCPIAREEWPDAPDAVPEILRVGIAGEPVQVQHHYSEAPYAVTILGQPEPVGETILRLPVRYTSIVGRWPYEWATLVQSRMALTGDDGELSFWQGVPCAAEVEQSGQIVKGGWIDSHICFAPAEEPEALWEDGLERPESWVEFNVGWLLSDPLERPVYIDLTQQVTPAPPAQFENGRPLSTVAGIDERLRFISWPSPDDVPLRSYGDPVEVFGAYHWNSFKTIAISEVETVDSTMVRVRVSLANDGLLFSTADKTGIELTGLPNSHGFIDTVWRTTYTDNSGTLFPDSFRDVEIERGESFEAYMYFRAPEGVIAPVDGMSAILWAPDINGDYTPIYLDIDKGN